MDEAVYAVKSGDIVSFCFGRGARVVHALIIRWDRDPDSLALMMDNGYKTYLRYVDSCRPPGIPPIMLTLADSLPVKRQLIQITATKRAQRIIQLVMSREKIEMMPSEGRGALEPWQAPMKLAEGLNSSPTKQLISYVSQRRFHEGSFETLERATGRLPESVLEVYAGGDPLIRIERIRRMLTAC